MDKLSSYNSFFREIIDTINSARYQAFKSLNKFHIGQNFEIGRIIVENQDKNQWGQSIVDTLSKDINKQIDGMKGYSPQNLWRMRQFYLEYDYPPSKHHSRTATSFGILFICCRKIFFDKFNFAMIRQILEG